MNPELLVTKFANMFSGMNLTVFHFSRNERIGTIVCKKRQKIDFLLTVGTVLGWLSQRRIHGVILYLF